MDSDNSDYCYDVDDDDVADDDMPEVVDDNVVDGSYCKVITKECLSAAQREDMQRVMDLLSLKEHHARTLLIHYRWDVNKIFDVFGEKGKEQLYKEASVVVRDGGDVSSIQSSLPLCQICMEEVPLNKMTTMDCNHCFCNNCWTEHFKVKIKEGQSRRISCMAYKCNVICDEDKIRDYVSEKDPDLASKFDRFLLESYIDDNKMVKWCPSIPHCGNAVRVDCDECHEVECVCGLQFCFNCSSEAHSPCSCEMWELWTKKCKDDSETINWLTVNTKFCPNCHKPVEKNGGCNLVRCICGQPFCYLCGGATGTRHTWDSIEDHTCGRFKEEQIAHVKQAKNEIVRYTHYHNRFKAHTDSLKAESTLQNNLLEKITKLEDRELVIKDYSWVTDGVDRLFRSRKVLSYSYPFAYYMFNDAYLSDEMTKEERNNKQHLFEEQQQQLEGNIEKLSLFLEEPFEGYPEEKVQESRQNIIHLSKITDVLCKHLYHCIDNEILYHLRKAINIAPYRSSGADKAKELDQ